MAQYDLPYTGPQVEALLAKISELESEMPSKTSDLTNDSGFITSADVPTKTSDLNNDSGFITNAPVAAEAARAQAAEALLATISSLQAEISRATGVEGTLQDLIDGIAAKIPSAATAQNQLADKSYVNASIATASATFRGTYISLVALQAVAADENDYGYVISTDAVGNTIYNRYKYANSTWIFEYAIANPIFDSSQWAAINSAVTAELVAKLSALPDNATLTAALAAKQDVIDDLSSIRSKANSAYQKPAGGIPKSDMSPEVQSSLGKADSAVQESAIADDLTTDDSTKVLSAKQGAVLDGKVSQLGQQVIYDVTANNEGATFASLSALLSSENLSTLIPIAVRCGGMSIRFVQSPDNKYAQYRLIPSTFTAAQFTTVANWQGVTNKIQFGNKDLIESGGMFDILQRFSSELEPRKDIYTIKADGTFTNSTYKHAVIPVEKNDMFIIENYGDQSNVRYAFVTSDASSEGGIVPVVSGTQIMIVDAHSYDSVSIPDGCSYLIVNVDSTFYSKIYKLSTKFSSGEFLGNVNISDAVSVGNKGLSTSNSVAEYSTLCKYLEGTVKDNGTWEFDWNGKSAVFKIAENTKKLELKASQNGNTAISFLSDFTTPIDGQSANLLERIVVNSGVQLSRDVPPGTKYICLTIVSTQGADVLPQYFIIDGFDIVKSNRLSLQELYMREENSVRSIEEFKDGRIVTNGETCNFQVVSSETLKCAVVPCKEGNEFTVIGTGGSSSVLWAFVDSSNNFIEKSDRNITETNLLLKAPENSVYLILNVNKNFYYKVFIGDILTGEFRRINENLYRNEFGNPNLNQLVFGNNDANISWWFYPPLISSGTDKEHVFYGFVDKEGYSGVADCQMGLVPRTIKNRLKLNIPDTHNSVAVSIAPDGRVIAAYTDGHNAGDSLYIRISPTAYSAQNFEKVKIIKTGTKATYAQIHFVGNKCYVFLRSPGNTKWGYLVSEDLENWSEFIPFLTSNVICYLWLKPVSDNADILKFITYTNPEYEDPSIRMGYINFTSGNVYNSDNTVVGTLGTEVNRTSFTALIPKPDTGSLRMFDLAVTNLSETVISFCSYSTTSDSEYKVYRNGTIENVCGGGLAIYGSHYQSGMMFISPTKVVVGRAGVNYNDYDYIEIYQYSNGSWSFIKEVYKELKNYTSHKIRNAYPLVDVNGKYIIWFRGMYNSYYDYDSDYSYAWDTDIFMYDIENDRIIDN